MISALLHVIVLLSSIFNIYSATNPTNRDVDGKMLAICRKITNFEIKLSSDLSYILYELQCVRIDKWETYLWMQVNFCIVRPTRCHGALAASSH